MMSITSEVQSSNLTSPGSEIPLGVGGDLLADDASVEIVLKVQETCNLNCSYCYMYNLGNELYKSVPASTSLDVCESVAKFIVREFRSRNPKYVRLVMHGGEPMLMPPRRFRERMDAIISILKNQLTESQLKRVKYCMQTNATLVSEEWIDCLEDYKISTSVTIDGPKEFHDQLRVDKFGQGSYDRVIAGVTALQEAERRGRLDTVGCLLVINPKLNGETAYHHIADELGFKHFDFLLPFRDWESFDPVEMELVGQFLVSSFRAWVASENDGISVRLFNKAIKALLLPPNRNSEHLESSSSKEKKLGHYFIVVESDGSVMPDESLRPTYSGRFSDLNIAEVDMVDVIAAPEYRALIMSSLTLADECLNCTLRTACASGQRIGRLGMRYSALDGFARKTVFCSPFIALYSEVASYLRSRGVHDERLNLVETA